jgi:hypothetical protein
MIDSLKTYVAGALAIVLGLLLMVQTVRLTGAQTALNKAKLELSEEKALASKSVAVATTQARETEQALSEKASDTKKETNDQIRNLTAQRDALLKRVLNAELDSAAAAVVSKAATDTFLGAVAKGSHGGELLGSFGQEDVEEALRADTIRLQLAACYRQYEEARKALSQ